MRRGRPLETVVRPGLPVDLGLTLGPNRRGRGDPTWRIEPDGSWWHAGLTPAGAATVRYQRASGGVLVQAWGPGAEHALAAASAALGGDDRIDTFRPAGLVAEVHHRLPGLRIGRTGAVFASLFPSVLEQKVVSSQARASYRGLVRALGDPAPGPLPALRLQPAPEVLAATPSWAFHPHGVEMRRAGVVRYAAARAGRLEEAAGMPWPEARTRLTALPGVGPWTAAEVALTALGDPDAVSVGDFHLPHVVSWALAGEPRGTDERMLELLAPYEGHRGRVIRLLEAAGFGAPRFGPRLALQEIANL
jgi:3-methyladenine DNA glycosylase/8-oxoguanine DNA glycosylase